MPTNKISDLTIICFSLNRHAYIRRQIAYFYDFPITLIVVDGSSEPIGIDPEMIKNGKLDLKYFHIPGPHVEARLEKSLKELKTKYVCFLGDDDVLIKSGLIKAVDELENQPELQMAGGKVGKFIPVDGQRTGFFKWGYWSEDLEINNQNPISRLIQTIKLARTANLLYLVLKSDLLIKATNKIVKPFTFSSAYELLFTGIFIINSTYKMGSYPFWLRGNVPSISTKLYSNPDNSTWHTSKESDFIAEVLSDELVKQGCSESDSRKAALDYLSIHGSQCFPESEKTSSINQLYDIFRKTIAIRPRISKFILEHKNILNLFYFLFNKKSVNKFILSRYSGSAHLEKLNHDFFDVIKFWESLEIKLLASEEEDLKSLNHLLSIFPEGIKTNEDLSNYLNSKIKF